MNKVEKQTQVPVEPCRIQQVESTKGELFHNCGLHQSWHQAQLANHIILSRLEAKRLAMFFKRGIFDLPNE